MGKLEMSERVDLPTVDLGELTGMVADVFKRCDTDPAKKIIEMGTALVQIGTVLDDVPIEQARRAVQAAALLHGIRL